MLLEVVNVFLELTICIRVFSFSVFDKYINMPETFCFLLETDPFTLNSAQESHLILSQFFSFF